MQNEIIPDPELCLTPEKKTRILKNINGLSELGTDTSLELTPEKENVCLRPTKSCKKVCFDIPPVESDSSHMLNHEVEPARNVYIKNSTLSSCPPSSGSYKNYRLSTRKSNEGSTKLNARKQRTDKVSAQRKINDMTRPKYKSSDNTFSSSYLEKKHNLLCSTNKSESKEQNFELNDFKYNSSLVQGYRLQMLKEDKFDALETAIKRVENEEQLQREVMKSASVATNVDPDQKIYTNLNPIHENGDLNLMSSYMPKKYSAAKLDYDEGPDINSFPVDDLIKEVVLIADCTHDAGRIKPQLSDISSALRLYKQQCCHNEFDII